MRQGSTRPTRESSGTELSGRGGPEGPGGRPSARGQGAPGPAGPLDLTCGHISTVPPEAAACFVPATPGPRSKGRWRCTLREFGEGYRETSAVFVPLREKQGQPSASRIDDETRRETNEERARRRAKTVVRHKCLAIRADHLLTLTYRQNVEDFEQACEDLARFVRWWRSRCPGLTYVAVPERQRRGAWHWHVAFPGSVPKGLLRAMHRKWREICAHRGGNVDVAGAKRGNRARMAQYLAKYISKAQDGAEGRLVGSHRYRCSLGISVPARVFYVSGDPAEGMTWWCAEPHCGELVGCVLMEAGRRWACSWQTRGGGTWAREKK